jgi:hypothetical protein
MILYQRKSENWFESLKRLGSRTEEAKAVTGTTFTPLGLS